MKYPFHPDRIGLICSLVLLSPAHVCLNLFSVVFFFLSLSLLHALSSLAEQPGPVLPERRWPLRPPPAGPAAGAPPAAAGSCRPPSAGAPPATAGHVAQIELWGEGDRAAMAVAIFLCGTAFVTSNSRCASIANKRKM